MKIDEEYGVVIDAEVVRRFGMILPARTPLFYGKSTTSSEMLVTG